MTSMIITIQLLGTLDYYTAFRYIRKSDENVFNSFQKQSPRGAL